MRIVREDNSVLRHETIITHVPLRPLFPRKPSYEIARLKLAIVAPSRHSEVSVQLQPQLMQGRLVQGLPRVQVDR